MTSSKKIILSTFGSFGDIHPYMALAIELQARGHEPVIATSALYREKLETAGLKFFSSRPDLPPPQLQEPTVIEKVMHPRTGPKFLMEEIIFASLRDSYEDLSQAVVGADLLVTHPAAPAGPLVARKTLIPWISTVLAPMSFFSAYEPPVPPYWPWLNRLKLLGPRINGAMMDFMKRAYRPAAVEEFRHELGLDDFGSLIFEGQHSPHCVLALFSKLFAVPQPDWPRQTHVTGFAFYDGHRELTMPVELQRFLSDGPPPIVFTLGSSAVWVARDFFNESVTAATSLGQRAVLVIGDERNRLPESLPKDVIAVDYAPYQELLPHASVIVHHGGVGTTSQGLRAGVPTLIVPFAFDQPDNAAHAERLGTSRTLQRKHYLAPRVAHELDVLLSNPHYAARAKTVGEVIRKERGVANACDLIEQFLNQRAETEPEILEHTYASSH